VFSPFHGLTDSISATLRSADFPHLVLDGRQSPEQRAKSAASFSLSHRMGEGQGEGPAPVLLAGQRSMAFGFNFPHCHRVVMSAKD